MHEVRLAHKDETTRQKEIWKRCFGDPDSYIDFYYANRYKEDETAVLLQEGEILAMLTMFPVRTVFPDHRSLNTAMLYAIATHPRYQNRGLARSLMDFSNEYLRSQKCDLSVLVPASRQLFDYYAKQGYHEGFYLRETQLFPERQESLAIFQSSPCKITSSTPEEYNRRRNELLAGRLFVSYFDEDIAYQKRLAQESGGDIFTVDIEDIEGCFAIERISSDKLLIKELILPDKFILVAIRQIAQLLSAKEYSLRTPPHLGEPLGGYIRPFGMFKVNSGIDYVISPADLGYLGFAFD